MSTWIKCSERLPEDGDAVIVYYKLPHSKIWTWCAGEVDRYEGNFSIDTGGDVETFDITTNAYWMPLPELPEEEK